MPFVQTLAGLVLRPWLKPTLADASRLTPPLMLACERGWVVTEMALSGPSFWDRLDAVLAGEQEMIRAARACCDTLPAELLPRLGDAFRSHCLRDLWRARRLGILGPALPALDTWADDLARLADPDGGDGAEQHSRSSLAGELVHSGSPYLAELLTATPQALPLPVVVGRWCLARLSGDRPVRDVGKAPDLSTLWPLLSNHGPTVAALLEETRSAEQREHALGLDLFEECRGKGGQHHEVYKALWQAQASLGTLRTALRPGDGNARSDGKAREAVKRAAGWVRSLPDDQRRGRPALLNAVAKLHFAVGDFKAAGRDFNAVSAVTPDAAAQAEASANAYQAFLRADDRPAALQALLYAARIDARRYAPFPLDRLTPGSIVAAHERGVTFLCRREPGGEAVVVRSLNAEALGREAAAIVAEADVLRSLIHPAIQVAEECGFADPETRTRPYLLLAPFAGVSLAEHVAKKGVLSPQELVVVAGYVADALRVAHARNVYHGGVSPDTVLVRHNPKSRPSWEVKLTEFGFAAPAAGADPRQSPVTADLQAFGRLCCFALFKTAEPSEAQWAKVPPSLAGVLKGCAGDQSTAAPLDFADALEALRRVSVRPPGQPQPTPHRPTQRQMAPPPARTNPLDTPRRPVRRPRPIVTPPRPQWSGAGARFIPLGLLILAGCMCGVFRGMFGPSDSPSYSPPSYSPPPINYQPQYQQPNWPPPSYGPTIPDPNPGGGASGFTPGGYNPYNPPGGYYPPTTPGVPDPYRPGLPPSYPGSGNFSGTGQPGMPGNSYGGRPSPGGSPFPR